MNVVIEIHYTGEGRTSQSASLPQQGRKPELIAYEWWKQIKREMSYRSELEKVIVDGDQDITQLVIKLEKQEYLKAFNSADDLPF